MQFLIFTVFRAVMNRSLTECTCAGLQFEARNSCVEDEMICKAWLMMARTRGLQALGLVSSCREGRQAAMRNKRLSRRANIGKGA